MLGSTSSGNSSAGTGAASSTAGCIAAFAEHASFTVSGTASTAVPRAIRPAYEMTPFRTYDLDVGPSLASMPAARTCKAAQHQASAPCAALKHGRGFRGSKVCVAHLTCLLAQLPHQRPRCCASVPAQCIQQPGRTAGPRRARSCCPTGHAGPQRRPAAQTGWPRWPWSPVSN